MGFFEWLGISPRDAPALPEVTDNVRDSGQTFVFGRADSGERVDEKSAMQIATVYACVRLLAETVAGLPLHLYRMKDGSNAKERAVDHPLYKLLMEGRIIHGGHPVMRWMSGNVVVDTDPAGNIKCTKAKSPEKIDGIVAAIMALDRCIRHENTSSVYDERGLMVF